MYLPYIYIIYTYRYMIWYLYVYDMEYDTVGSSVKSLWRSSCSLSQTEPSPCGEGPYSGFQHRLGPSDAVTVTAVVSRAWAPSEPSETAGRRRSCRIQRHAQARCIAVNCSQEYPLGKGSVWCPRRLALQSSCPAASLRGLIVQLWRCADWIYGGVITG